MAQRYTKFSNLPNKILKSCSQNSQKCLLTYTFFDKNTKINKLTKLTLAARAETKFTWVMPCKEEKGEDN